MKSAEEKLKDISDIKEVRLKGKKNGVLVLLLVLAIYGLTIFNFIRSINILERGSLDTGDLLLFVLTIIWFSFGWLVLLGLKLLKPQESLVLTLFGKYIGTLRGEGYYFVNPFSIAVNPAADTKLSQSGDVVEKKLGLDLNTGKNNVSLYSGSKKISLKAMTLNNSRQKINDYMGNPIEIGIAVIWKVVDTAKAVFNVDNYKEYLSLQCDSALRNIVRQYPYDVDNKIQIDTTGDGIPDDGSLRGSSEVVARRIREEIQDKVEFAGIEIIEARITHLSYASEIAASMLRRQQAQAIIDARIMIVDGAVGMVQQALQKLEEDDIVELDEERKAQMVSNLLVTLCSDKEVSPVVNTGSIY